MDVFAEMESPRKKLKCYQVVEFSSTGSRKRASLAVIYRKWIYLEEGQYYCLLPKNKTNKEVEEMIQQKIEISREESKTFPVKIIGQSKKYETATELAADLQDHSDVPSSDGTASEPVAVFSKPSFSEIVKRSRRRKADPGFLYEKDDLEENGGGDENVCQESRKKPKRGHGGTSKSSSAVPNPTVPIFPDVQPSTSRDSLLDQEPIERIEADMDLMQGDGIEGATRIEPSNGQQVHSLHNPTEKTENPAENARLAAMEKRLAQLERRDVLVEIQNRLDESKPDAPAGIPLHNKEGLRSLNDVLKSKMEKAVYVRYLHALITNHYGKAKCIRKILEAVFTSDFAVLCNLNGSSKKAVAAGLGKHRIRDYPDVLSCIQSAVMLKYPHIKHVFLNNKISRWFQGAIDHGNGRFNRTARSNATKELLLQNQDPLLANPVLPTVDLLMEGDS